MVLWPFCVWLNTKDSGECTRLRRILDVIYITDESAISSTSHECQEAQFENISDLHFCAQLQYYSHLSFPRPIPFHLTADIRSWSSLHAPRWEKRACKAWSALYASSLRRVIFSWTHSLQTFATVKACLISGKHSNFIGVYYTCAYVAVAFPYVVNRFAMQLLHLESGISVKEKFILVDNVLIKAMGRLTARCRWDTLKATAGVHHLQCFLQHCSPWNVVSYCCTDAQYYTAELVSHDPIG